MNNKKRIYSLLAIAVLTTGLLLTSICFIVISVNNVKENRENNLRAVTQLVQSAIANSFVKPVTVAKAMSENTIFKDKLKEAETDPLGAEHDISSYLASLRDGLGYKMMFTVCDKSGAYYTCDGITSYIDGNYEGNSQWYGAFLNSGKDWDLDVDVEESTDWALSVFVNQKVWDENREFIGVCGTAVEMSQLQQILEQYERIYSVKIDVTDETGLIQIDTDATKIEKDYISLPDVSLISDGEYYYDTSDNQEKVYVYIKDMDMYLVVTNVQSQTYDIWSYAKYPFVITMVSLLLAGGFIVAARCKQTENGNN